MLQPDYILLVIVTLFFFVIVPFMEATYAFTNIKFLSDPIKDSVDALLENHKNEIVVSFRMLNEESQAVAFMKYDQKLKKELKTKSISECVINRSKTSLNVNKAFGILVEHLSSMIFKYEEVLYYYINKREPVYLEKEIHRANQFFEERLALLAEEFSPSTQYRARLKCFESDSVKNLKDKRSDALQRLKTFVLMMVIESTKPFLLKRFPNILSQLEKEEPVYSTIDPDIFFIMRGLKIKDVYFIMDTLPQPFIIGSNQYLAFPIDILTNPNSLETSIQFFNNFFSSTGMLRLLVELKSLRDKPGNKAATRAMNAYFLAELSGCIEHLISMLRRYSKEYVCLQVGKLELNEKTYLEKLKSAIESNQRNNALAFRRIGTTEQFDTVLGTVFRQNLPMMLLLKRFFQHAQGSYLASTIRSPLSYGQRASSSPANVESRSLSHVLTQTYPTSLKADTSTSASSTQSSSAMGSSTSSPTGSRTLTQILRGIRKHKSENTQRDESISSGFKRARKDSTAPHEQGMADNPYQGATSSPMSLTASNLPHSSPDETEPLLE